MKVGAFGRGPGRWRLDETTKRFLAELEAGKRPRIEDHLERVEAPARAPLLRELLAAEARFRTRQGESVASGDYAARFPELTGEEIEQIILTGDSAAGSASAETGGTLQPGVATDAAPLHESWEDSHGVISSYDGDTSAKKEDESTVLWEPGQDSPDLGHADSSYFPPLRPFPPPPPIPPPPPEPPRPLEIGRYRVIRTLGSGTYGVVVEAADPELDRHVALKLPRQGRKLSTDAVAKFRAEGRVLARLRHPGLVAVYDAGVTPDGRPFVVSELVDGEDLAARIAREGRLKVDEATRIVAEAAEALAAAHAAGVVHRDVKPANLMLNKEGDVRVADFGIALQDEQQERAKGEVCGSPAYMAPEQFTGESHLLDGRADVWALGVVLYELLTGKRPFPAQSFDGLKEEVLKRDPRPLRQLNPKLPSWTEAIVAKCLAKNASDRYGTAADLAMDLRRGQVGYSERRRGRRALLAFGLVLLVAIAAGGFAAVRAFDLDWPWNEAKQMQNNGGSPNSERGPLVAHTPDVSPVPEKQKWIPEIQGVSAVPGAEFVELYPRSDTVAPARIIKTVAGPNGSIEVPFVLIAKRHRNDPPAFYIMETKVWNELFGVFAKAHPEAVVDSQWTKGAEAGPQNWLGVEGNAAEYPVVNVRLAEAVRFSTWLGGKLPSADQWDKAAGLNDIQGSAVGPYTSSGGIVDVAVGRESEGPVPVGSAKDDLSVLGVRDVAGNGWELTRTNLGGFDLPPVEDFEHDSTLQVNRRGRSFSEDGPLTFIAMKEWQPGVSTAHHWTSFRVVFEQPEEE